MRDQVQPTRSLSDKEARLVLDLEERDQRTVRTEEIQKRLGISEGHARILARRLVTKGWLDRLRPGLFQLIPARRGQDAVPDMNPLVAGADLVRPYFYSFGTASTHHGFTEQVFAEVYIACESRRVPTHLRGKRYVFARVPPERFFGFETVKVLGQSVEMATRERALLDAVDRPRFAGGLGEVSRIVRRAARKVSWDQVLSLLERLQRSSIAQRLGYLLEFHGLEPEARMRLATLVRPAENIHLGSRARWAHTGRLVRPWNVVVNVPREVLEPKGERFAPATTPGTRDR